MDEMIRLRCLAAAAYMVQHQATVRQTAKALGMSKSSVHKDMMERLPHISHAQWLQVQALMRRNKAERHLRGGDATRRRYARDRAAKALQNPSDALY